MSLRMAVGQISPTVAVNENVGISLFVTALKILFWNPSLTDNSYLVKEIMVTIIMAINEIYLTW